MDQECRTTDPTASSRIDPPDGPPADSSGGGRPGDVDPLRVVAENLAALREQVHLLLQTRWDAGWLWLRARVWGLVAWMVLLVTTQAVTIAALVHVMRGTAMGLSQVLGGRVWLGHIICGCMFLVAAGFGVWSCWLVSRGRAMRRLKARYERHRARA